MSLRKVGHRRGHDYVEPMQERRVRRNELPAAAAQLLIEALAARSLARAVALVDDTGHVLAGTGAPADLANLSRLAGPPERGEACADFDAITRDADLYMREVTVPGATLYLAALGTRMRRFHDAAAGVARILSAG